MTSSKSKAAHPAPTKKELRTFSLIMATGLAILFVLIPLALGKGFRSWPLIVGGVFVAFGLLAPAALAPVYSLWMKMGEVLGFINSRIILGVIFYFIIFPVGLIRRIFAPDPMARKIDKNAPTYRVPRDDKDIVARMQGPY